MESLQPTIAGKTKHQLDVHRPTNSSSKNYHAQPTNQPTKPTNKIWRTLMAFTMSSYLAGFDKRQVKSTTETSGVGTRKAILEKGPMKRSRRVGANGTWGVFYKWWFKMYKIFIKLENELSLIFFVRSGKWTSRWIWRHFVNGSMPCLTEGQLGFCGRGITETLIPVKVDLFHGIPCWTSENSVLLVDGLKWWLNLSSCRLKPAWMTSHLITKLEVQSSKTKHLWRVQPGVVRSSLKEMQYRDIPTSKTNMAAEKSTNKRRCRISNRKCGVSSDRHF